MEKIKKMKIVFIKYNKKFKTVVKALMWVDGCFIILIYFEFYINCIYTGITWKK